MLIFYYLNYFIIVIFYMIIFTERCSYHHAILMIHYIDMKMLSEDINAYDPNKSKSGSHITMQFDI